MYLLKPTKIRNNQTLLLFFLERQDDEGGPNWELFANKNRFFLPGLQAPVNQQNINEFKKFPLNRVIDFQGKVSIGQCHHSKHKIGFLIYVCWFLLLLGFQSNTRLHISYHTCPRSLQYIVGQTFPERMTKNRKELMIITLSYKHFEDVEMGQRYVSVQMSNVIVNMDI